MKPIKILKTLINIFYYLLGVGILSKLISFLPKILNQKQIAPSFLRGDAMYSLGSAEVIIVEIFMFLLILAFFSAIHFLKHSLIDLSAGNPFSEKVIRSFKHVGILLIICAIGELLGKLLASLLILNEIDINADSSMVLFPVMGLFFLYLSEVFNKAKEFQSENELTV